MAMHNSTAGSISSDEFYFEVLLASLKAYHLLGIAAFPSEPPVIENPVDETLETPTPTDASTLKRRKGL